MAELFGRDYKTIAKHINNALREELEGMSVVANFATPKKYGRRKGSTQTHNIYKTGELSPDSTCAQVRQEGKRQVSRQIPFYNLDVVISIAPSRCGFFVILNFD